MKLRPLHDRVVVKRIEEQEKTKGGIIIPDSAKEKPVEGMVIAVGNGKVLKSGKLQPLGDRVLVKPVEAKEMKRSGIIIPDSAKEKPVEGKVIAVGNGKVSDDGKVRALEVKPGDRVLFGKYSGQEIKVDGEEMVILREDDIVGIVT
jgi:chaperonin GroES